MKIYIIFWIVFLLIKALIEGHSTFQKNRKAGHHINHLNKTGEKVMVSSKDIIPHTLMASLGPLLNPAFILISTIMFIPAAFVLYLIQ